MHLLLDTGNTAFKWRASGCGVVLRGAGRHGRDWRALARAIAAQVPRPGAITVASVAGRDADAQLGCELGDALGAVPRFVYSTAELLGVRNAYADPGRLGVDRWLALVEAWHRGGAAVVIDCGSALTLDAVDGEGRHRGGYIVPGLGMLRSCLHTGTADVRPEPATAPSLDPGRSTSSCVHNGVLRMSVAFVTDAAVALREGLPDTCSIFLTGGDAALMESHLKLPVRVVPDLVLDGLERVAARTGPRG